jgi:putative toxin-antitoxin system antitoxin component (TIGR02293 family)
MAEGNTATVSRRGQREGVVRRKATTPQIAGHQRKASELSNLVTMARRAERGIPKAEAESIIERVAAGSSMPRGKVRAELIPDSSWKRAGKVLGPQASQTAARLSRVFAFAEKVWGSEKEAADWMNRPHMELGGATPYSMLRTEAGGHAVMNVLVALEYGFPV